MKKVMQTILEYPKGNCLQACLASIFEKELEEIPNFLSYEDEEWWDKYTKFMIDQFGVYPLSLSTKDEAGEEILPHGYHIIIGKSPRGKYNHAIVGLDGKFVYDPYPDGNGVRTVTHYEIFVSILK